MLFQVRDTKIMKACFDLVFVELAFQLGVFGTFEPNGQTTVS